MPPSPLLDVAALDCSRVLYSREHIYSVLPQQHEFAQLDAVIYLDKQDGTGAAYRDVRPDEWWCRGHLPGYPLFPGVLMLESAAQLAAFVRGAVYPEDNGAFMAFGGIDNVKFRGSVVPPARIIFVGRGVEQRSRRFIYDVQSFVDGDIVFEGRITGLRMKA
jgi:3-hydroxyacyl-[acyl-carrier-protein] dehydratase